MTAKYIRFLVISAVIAVLMPARLLGADNSQKLGLRTVVIDPGHGGKDPGAV